MERAICSLTASRNALAVHVHQQCATNASEIGKAKKAIGT